jgi:hypothetical protein
MPTAAAALAPQAVDLGAVVVVVLCLSACALLTVNQLPTPLARAA